MMENPGLRGQEQKLVVSYLACPWAGGLLKWQVGPKSSGELERKGWPVTEFGVQVTVAWLGETHVSSHSESVAAMGRGSDVLPWRLGVGQGGHRPPALLSFSLVSIPLTSAGVP